MNYYKLTERICLNMQLEQTPLEIKDVEILMMKNELKKFVQRMQAEGFLTTVDIEEVMTIPET